MATLQEVSETQKALSAMFLQKMSDFRAELKAKPQSPNADKVTPDFNTFMDIVLNLLSGMQSQIDILSRTVDVIETRHRRKYLLFNGVPEKNEEDLSATVISVLQGQMKISNVTPQSIRYCHRLGEHSKDKTGPRTVLVRFADTAIRAVAWSSKTKLKGTGYVLREFLTKTRQEAFNAARNHFGMTNVWTSDGNIVVKLPTGGIKRVHTTAELDGLAAKHPKENDSPVIQITESPTKASTSSLPVVSQACTLNKTSDLPIKKSQRDRKKVVR